MALTVISGYTPGTIDYGGGERGSFVLYQGSDPAAGEEFSETVPAGKLWRLISVSVQLVAGSDVGDRDPILQIDDGSSVVVLKSGFNLSLKQSETAQITWAAFGFEQVTQDILAIEALLPEGIYLWGGLRLRSITTGLFAADNYGAPTFLVEEW